MPAPKHKPEQAVGLFRNGKLSADLALALQQQAQLLDWVRALLPAPLNQHCMHARLTDNVLTLHLDSATWISLMRFQEPSLKKQLQAQIPSLQCIKTRVSMPEAPIARAVEKPQLEPQAADLILECAAGISDTGLSAAMAKLVRDTSSRL